MNELKEQIIQFHQLYFDLQHTKVELQKSRMAMVAIDAENEDLLTLIHDTTGTIVRSNILGRDAGMKLGGRRSSQMLPTAGTKDGDADLDLPDDEEDGFLGHIKTEKKSFFQKLRSWYERMQPFSVDIRKIEAKFGGASASFFVFNRWILLQAIFIQPIILASAGNQKFTNHSDNI
jgi:hypothetical protein